MRDERAITQQKVGEHIGVVAPDRANEGAVPLPSTTTAMLAEMDTALAEEIVHLKRGGSSGHSHVARQGQSVKQTGIHYIYEYVLDELWEPEDHTPLRIQIPGSSTVRASVVSALGTRLKISTEEALPVEAIEQITLVDDPTQLLERLREVLKSNVEGVSQLGSKTFTHLPFANARRQELVRYPEFMPRESQKDAIRLSLGSEVAYIIGPPGTGKTSTLAAIAYTLACEGQSILIAANTNIAVDNAIVNLADMCQKAELPALSEGHIIRFGIPQVDAVRTRADIYPPEIAKRLAHDLARQRDDLNAEHSRANSHLKDIIEREALQAAQWNEQRDGLLARREALQRELEALLTNERQRVSDIDAKLQPISQENTRAERLLEAAHEELTRLVSWQSQTAILHVQHLALASDLAARLSAAQQMNSIGRLMRGINLNHLTKRVAEVKQLVWSDKQALDEANQRLEIFHERVSAAQQEWERLKAQYRELMTQRQTPSSVEGSTATLRTEIEQCSQQLVNGDRIRESQTSVMIAEQTNLTTTAEQLAQQILELDEKLHDIERRLLDEAQVVATTLTSVYLNKRLCERRFDCVIMDEVSMAPLPAVYVAASRADVSVIAIGDPYQLAPIATSYTPLVRKWLKRDLFALAGVSLKNAGIADGRSSLLREQSRMHPAISTIARTHVYHGLIADAYEQPKLDYSQIAPAPGKQLVLCDTSDGAPVTSKPAKSSRFNVYHALCTLAVVRQILDSLPDCAPDPDSRQRIGIVTPYKPQAKLIQRMIKASGFDKVVRVGTVHRFQGLQYEAIIFDTVESPPVAPAPFICGGDQTEGQRLINVAVTRPQHKLVIIANAPYVTEQIGKSDTLRLAVEEARKSAVITSRELLGDFADALRPHQTGESKPLGVAIGAISGFSNYTALTAETFFEQFLTDVRAAKSRIIILSPYVYKWRTNKVVKALQEKHKMGVDIGVLANEENETETANARKTLVDAGIPVYTSPGMHEKMIFIDNTITYLGSLNSLSHRSTTESMQRIVSGEVSLEWWKLLRVSERLIPIIHGQDLAIPFRELQKTSGGNCPECGGLLQVRRDRKENTPFNGCSNFPRCRFTDNVGATQLAMIPELKTLACDHCAAGAMGIHVVGEHLWLECAAAVPCGHRRKIVIQR